MAWVVLVSGGPGAGKTTLAPALAAGLGLPLLAKDTIKEALADELGLGDEVWSRRLGGAAFDVLYALIPKVAPAVVEAYWHNDHARPRLAAMDLPVVEVFCRCPLPVLAERFERRARSGDRHPIHREMYLRTSIDTGALPEPEPVGLGPVLEVSTLAPVAVEPVVAWVQDQVRALSP